MTLRQDEKQVLAELPATPYGVVLKKLLDTELADLRDVTRAESWDDVLARKHSIEIIEKIFQFMDLKKPSSAGRSSYE